MTDIVEELRQGALTRDDYRWKAADEIERLRAALRVSVCYLPYWRPKTELARQIKLDTLAMARAALEGK